MWPLRPVMVSLAVRGFGHAGAPENRMRESPVELPESIRLLFWEYAEGAVSWERHRDFVVERVLSRGDWDAICWVRRQAGDAGLLDTLRRTRGRWLSRPQIRFWRLIFGLPDAEVETWLSSEARPLWDGRTA